MNHLFFIVEKLRSQSNQVREKKERTGREAGVPALRKSRGREHPAVSPPLLQGRIGSLLWMLKTEGEDAGGLKLAGV